MFSSSALSQQLASLVSTFSLVSQQLTFLNAYDISSQQLKALETNQPTLSCVGPIAAVFARRFAHQLVCCMYRTPPEESHRWH
jgi:hypothetical protein